MSKLFLVSFLLMMITGSCKSPLSEGNLNDLSAIDARIEIYQDLTNREKNEITVFLYDKDGKSIRNKTIKMKVNDTELAYKERQELYYTTTSKYYAINVPVEQEYSFQITLSNGKPYFLGRIRSLAENNEKNIICDEKGDFDKDFAVSWKNLRDINELSITKSMLLSTSTKTRQNYDSEPEVTKTVASKGVYIIPKSHYIGPKSKISGVEIKFSALKFGTMNPELLENSKIKIFGHMERYVDFEEEN